MISLTFSRISHLLRTFFAVNGSSSNGASEGFDLSTNQLQAEDAGHRLSQHRWLKSMLYFKEE